MEPTVVDPPFGSVENFEAMLRRFQGSREGYLLGVITAIVSDLYGDDTQKVQFVRNALTADGRVSREVIADPTGLAYTRADDDAEDPTPTGPREPLHTGGMTEGGLVDETGGYWDPSVTSVPAADYTAGGDL